MTDTPPASVLQDERFPVSQRARNAATQVLRGIGNATRAIETEAGIWWSDEGPITQAFARFEALIRASMAHPLADAGVELREENERC